MNQPKRWLDSASNPKIRDLLRAGLADDPDAQALPRTAAALGFGAAVTVVSASALAAGASTQGTLASTAVAGVGATSATGAALATGSGGVSALIVGKWLVVGFLSGGVASAGLVVSQAGFGSRSGEAPQVASSVRAAERVAGPPRARVSASTLSSPAVQVRAPSRDESEAAPARVLREPGATTSGIPAPTGVSASNAKVAPAVRPSEPASKADETRGAIAAEVAWIDSARRALASGDVNRALAELDAFERARKLGVLDREAGLLRIDALRKKGDLSGARKVAQRYLDTFPGDAHAPRLREFLGGAETSP